MSTAICTACGTEIRWRATRGARLAEIRCKCGGELAAKRGINGDRKTYVARLTFVRRFGLGRRTRYYAAEDTARRERESAAPFYDSVILQLKNAHGWVVTHD